MDDPDDLEPDNDDGPCWCGELNPHFSDELDETCKGFGQLQCFCGGDMCVCHWHGTVDCGGCPDCEGLDYDDDDDDLEEE